MSYQQPTAFDFQQAGKTVLRIEREGLEQLDQYINDDFARACALNSSTQEWMRCREQLLHVASVNRELLLTDQLLNWADKKKPALVG